MKCVGKPVLDEYGHPFLEALVLLVNIELFLVLVYFKSKLFNLVM